MISLAIILVILSQGCQKEPFGQAGTTEVYSFFDAELIRLVASQDLSQWAGVFRKETKLYIVTNGEKSKDYDAIGMLTFSPDGKRFAYAAYIKGKAFLVIDGEKSKKSYDEIDFLTFSPDGKRLAYVAKEKNKMFVVVDGVEGKRYQGIRQPVFSSQGNKIAYPAAISLGYTSPRQWVAVVNEKENLSYEEIFNVALSPDGKRLTLSVKEREKMFVVVDGVKGKIYDWADWPTFSPDGKRLAYVAKEKNKMFVVVDGVEGKRYDSVYQPVFSSNGKNIAYISKENGKTFLIVNSREIKTKYQYLDNLTFSPEGKKIAYQAKNTKGWWVIVVNSKESRDFNLVSSPFFSPDGKFIGYYAQDGYKVVRVIELIR